MFDNSPNETNVDRDEVAKFAALASRWWDRESEFKILHEINPLRANWIDTHSPVDDRSVLDVGCGGGILCEALTLRGATVTGADMGEAPLSVAKLHALESELSINYLKNTAEGLAEDQAEYFDIVTCLEMLEHVPDPASVIEACARLVKPGGDLYFSTLNRNPKSWLFAIIGAEYLLHLLPKGTHDHDKFIRPSELVRWLRQADLELTHMTGLVYNPVSKTYRLNDRDVSVNYMVHARKPA